MSKIAEFFRPSWGPGSGREPANHRSATIRPGPPTDGAQTRQVTSYPGDFHGGFAITYQPVEGDLPDPGEVVWTWVPYEEDYRKGKDRPVLIVGRDSGWLLAVPLTSKDHDLDAAQEAAAGRFWVEIGRGAWDSAGRVSEARVNRVVRVDPAKVRRIACQLDRAHFEAVAAGIRRHWN